MNRSAKGLSMVTTNLVWRIADDLPNSPNFLPAKLSRYTVVHALLNFILTKHKQTPVNDVFV